MEKFPIKADKEEKDAEKISKTSITEGVETVGIDIENGKKILKLVLERIAGNLIDKKGKSLIVPMGGEDGLYQLNPETLKELVIICDKKIDKKPVISDGQLMALEIKARRTILEHGEKILDGEISSKK